jgi:GT2 family glycosyltransferase
MKVRDLIKDTLWRPGLDYDGARPLVSVLMPTFRRAHGESFLKAVNSILRQTLRNIELIVVDDGSTDGTAQQIEAFMAADGRVSCLRHPENIGLPAISEYEAFVRARGEFVAFGFDDFIFEPDALSDLVAFPPTSSRSVVHGYVAWFDGRGNQHFYGRDPVPHEQMKFFNFLANAGFLVPRAILEDVGLFDPHIAAARLCDWDLWFRILKKYPIYRAPVLIGVEHGNTRADSLENTYPLFEESLQDYFGADRDALLKPANFPEFDVWKMPETPSVLLTAHILKARQFFGARLWASCLPFAAGVVAETSLTPESSTIGIFGALNISTAMIFDGLPQSHRQRLLHIHPDLTDAQLGYYLVGCGAVIMARHLLDARSERVRSMCAAMQIPLYYLIDDNPVATSNRAREFEGYTTDNLASVLRDFAGVLCASAPLAAFCRENRLHASVRELTPVFDRAKQEKFDRNWSSPDAPDVRIGVIGGGTQPETLARIVPALRGAGQRVAIQVLADSAELSELPFPVQLIDPTVSLDEFLTRWKPLGPDILIHARGSFEATSYANAELSLIARYLRAVPLVFGGEAVDGSARKSVASAQAIESAILAACDPACRAEKRRWLEAHCATAFAPDQNIRVLVEIAARSRPVDTVNLVFRLRKMLEYNASRAVLAEGELQECASRLAQAEIEAVQAEGELQDRASRLAKAEIELASRSYRVALRLRTLANWLRKINRWFRPG